MIDVEVQSGISVIRMNHGKVNAMDLEFCKSLSGILRQVESSDSTSAILVGNDRLFSAGVDLVRLLDEEMEYVNVFLSELTECFKAIFQFSKPLVAAINGHALAGGCILATACDHRVIHDKARIGVPELRVGVPLPSIAIEILRYAVAPMAFQAMVNVGRSYRGEEALSVGLADRIVDQKDVLEAAIESAQDLTKIPQSVFEISKRQMRAPANRNVASNESEFEETIKRIWESDENRQVIKGFVEKRL